MVIETNKVDSRILQYIDAHIEENLSVRKIADEAGYSEFHFSRIFKEEMKMTLKDYVIRRKLIKASEEIIAGRKIVDTAFMYGWESHSGFTKAFKKEFGFSPSLLKMMVIEMKSLGGSSMSHVFLESTKQGMSKEELFQVLVEKIRENGLQFNISEIEKIYLCADKAYAGRKRYSGEEYVTHPINVAILLADLGADIETVYAGLFCDVLRKGKISIEQLKKNLPEKTNRIIWEAQEFDNREAGSSSEEVILLKLVERLHNMRTVQFMDQAERKKKAEETIAFFLPMAREIENQKLINELNDLCIKYL